MKKIVVRPGRSVQEKIKIPIPVSGLKIGMYVCELDRPWLETPFTLQGFKITTLEDIEVINQHCEFVYIEQNEDHWLEAQEHPLFEKRKSRTRYPSPEDSLQEFTRAQSIHRSARHLTRSFMDDVRLGQAINIKEITSTVSECVSSILRSPDAMIWLSRIRKKDDFTCEHSLNVALLAIAFGRHLGASVEDLNKLGLVGLLHDVGKMRIPNEILSKKSKLDHNEMSIMQTHTRHGRDILIAHKNIYHGVVDVAYSHHETLDGKGYPRQIKASGITDFSRIITLCDTYDSITSDRNYKKGRSSLDALKILYQNKGTKYDDKLVTEFISCIGLYPSGSVVELTNGQAGIVISTNYRHRHLPKVLVIRDAHKAPMPESVLDLERLASHNDQRHFIKTVIANGSYGIRVEDYIEKGLCIE
ncbi:HD-GYP domain-containing protein [bacterium AH-315-K03]|nr:HD-GYP domain-containing protein [bacterium AH-315-K03]